MNDYRVTIRGTSGSAVNIRSQTTAQMSHRHRYHTHKHHISKFTYTATKLNSILVSSYLQPQSLSFYRPTGIDTSKIYSRNHL